MIAAVAAAREPYRRRPLATAHPPGGANPQSSSGGGVSRRRDLGPRSRSRAGQSHRDARGGRAWSASARPQASSARDSPLRFCSFFAVRQDSLLSAAAHSSGGGRPVLGRAQRTSSERRRGRDSPVALGRFGDGGCRRAGGATRGGSPRGGSESPAWLMTLLSASRAATISPLVH